MSQELRSERLRFRTLCDADFDAVHGYASDPAVVRYTSFGPNTPQETVAFLAACGRESAEVPRRAHTFGVIERATGRLIGSCAIAASDAAGRQFALGYCFSRAAWQQGYGRETGRALTEFGFETLNAHRLWAVVFVENRPSARILERLGFRQEGLTRQGLYARGAWHDIYTYAKLKSEHITST